MKLRSIFLLALLALVAACSSTDEPVDTKGLHLSIYAAGNSGNVAAFQLHLLKDGVPFKGAKLTERYYPKHLIDTLPTRSDSAGQFIFHVFLDDSTTQIAFQAVTDSGLSNSVVWP